MSALLIKALMAYILGSVSGSLLLGKLRGVDIRTLGSGNAGGTNALRTQGFWFALFVVVVDVGKGVLAAAWLPGLVLPASLLAPAPLSLESQALLYGGMAILGHCYPLFHGFRGGKGVATLLGVLAVCLPWSVPVFLLAFLLTLLASGYVALASMLATSSLVLSVLIFEPYRSQPAALVFALLMTGFVIYSHRSNIHNLARGVEYRFERVLARRWFRRKPAGQEHDPQP